MYMYLCPTLEREITVVCAQFHGSWFTDDLQHAQTVCTRPSFLPAFNRGPGDEARTGTRSYTCTYSVHKGVSSYST